MLRILDSKFKTELEKNTDLVLATFANYRDEINRQMIDVQQ